MSNLIEKITLIGRIFDDIANAIVEKGVDIGQCEGPETYADKIRQIIECNHPDIPDEPIFPAEIQCDYNKFTFESDGGVKEVTVTYLRYNLIHSPLISYVSDSGWLQIDTLVDGDNSLYKITVSKNESTANRSAKITFACEDDQTEAKHEITIIQNGCPTDEPVDPEVIVNSQMTIPFYLTKDYYINVVYKNYTSVLNPVIESDITNDEGKSWISLAEPTIKDSTYTYKITTTLDESWFGENRVATITFSCKNDSKTSTGVITLKQNADPNAINPELEIVVDFDVRNNYLILSSDEQEHYIKVLHSNWDRQYKSEVTSDCDWLIPNEKITINENGDFIFFNVLKNNTVNKRIGNINVALSNWPNNGGQTGYGTLVIEQAGGEITPEAQITYVLSLTPESLTIDKGDTGMFKLAVTKYVDGVFESKFYPEDNEITWISSDTSIVSVIKGEVTGLTAGTATVTATYQEQTINGTVVVNEKYTDIQVTGISLNKNNLVLNEGDNEQLIATIEPSNATNKNIIWTTSVPGVATVNGNGLVTAIKKGTTKITATSESNNKEATCTVVVYNTVSVTSVTLDKTSYEMTEGDEVILTATVSPENATNKNVYWTSSNQSVATVDNAGKVTAHNAGTTTIIVTTEDSSKTASCLVTVNVKEVEPPIEEPSPMYYGYIPYDSSIEPATWKSEGFNLITEEWILDGVTNGNITKVDAGVMGKTSFGVVPKKSLLLIAVPSDSGLVATMDDGDNAKVKFDSTTPNSNGEYTVAIDGIAYDLYGQYAPIDYPAESKFFYID